MNPELKASVNALENLRQSWLDSQVVLHGQNCDIDLGEHLETVLNALTAPAPSAPIRSSGGEASESEARLNAFTALYAATRELHLESRCHAEVLYAKEAAGKGVMWTFNGDTNKLVADILEAACTVGSCYLPGPNGLLAELKRQPAAALPSRDAAPAWWNKRTHHPDADRLIWVRATAGATALARYKPEGLWILEGPQKEVDFPFDEWCNYADLATLRAASLRGGDAPAGGETATYSSIELTEISSSITWLHAQNKPMGELLRRFYNDATRGKSIQEVNALTHHV